MKEFNRFYDREVSVYCEQNSGYDTVGEDTLLGTVICDVQPYDADTQSNIYGLSDNKAYKLYCSENDLIKSGRRVRLNGGLFRIIRVEQWKFGLSAIVKEI